VLINTAVAQARDPAQMAAAFAQAVEAGRAARLADRSSRATSPHPRRP